MEQDQTSDRRCPLAVPVESGPWRSAAAEQIGSRVCGCESIERFRTMARQRILGRCQVRQSDAGAQEAFRQRPGLSTTEQPEPATFMRRQVDGRPGAQPLADELTASDGVRGCLCLG